MENLNFETIDCRILKAGDSILVRLDKFPDDWRADEQFNIRNLTGHIWHLGGHGRLIAFLCPDRWQPTKVLIEEWTDGTEEILAERKWWQLKQKTIKAPCRIRTVWIVCNRRQDQLIDHRGRVFAKAN